MILTGLEKFGFVLLFYTPDEFFIKLVSQNESIKLSKIKQKDKVPSKNEISATSKFLIEHNSEYVLCEILDDLKFDEIFCQVLLCNSNIKLKVDYRKLLYLNSDDIVNDETCLSLKFHDFSPNQKNWSSDVISKLKKLMLFNKFVFNFKSLGVDPFDGRFPVDVLSFHDRKCINDQFIDENLAVRSSEYFKEKIENEVTQIFYSKMDKYVCYKVSVPLAKVKPRSRPKPNQIKPLNISAQPFIPLREPIENSPVPITTSNPIGLQTNIVNMFSEMYRNRQEKVNKSSTVPFTGYQTVFPSYGGVNFSKETNVSFSKPNQLKINNISNQTSSVNPDSPQIIYNTTMNSQAPSFIMPSNANAVLIDQSNCLPENSNLPPPPPPPPPPHENDSHQSFVISESSNPSSYVISKPPVYYGSNHQEQRSDNSNPICSSSVDSMESISPMFTSVQSTPLTTNDANNTPDVVVIDSQHNSSLSNTDDLVISSLTNLSLSQHPPPSSASFLIDNKPPIYSSYQSSTSLNNSSFPTTAIFHPSMFPGNMSAGGGAGAHNFGNVIIQAAPMMPSFEFMKRYPPVPASFQQHSFPQMMPAFNPIHQDNLFKFHPHFRPEIINNANFLKYGPNFEKKDEENRQIINVDKPAESGSIPEGMWFQPPPQFVPASPQSGRMHVQPINLIYYQPDR